MTEQAVDDSRQGENAPGPTEAEIGQILVGDIELSEMVHLHVPAAEGHIGSGCILGFEAKRPAGGHPHIDAEVHPARHKAGDRVLLDVCARQIADRAKERVEQELNHRPGDGCRDIRHDFSGVRIAPGLPVFPGFGLRDRRDGPGLEKPEHAIANGPLDVLGTAELSLDASNGSSESPGGFEIQRGLAGHQVPANQLQILFSQKDAIWLDLAGDESLAQPSARLDHDPAAAARDRVEAERHSGGIRLNLPLHDDGHLDLLVVDAVASAIFECPLSPQRGPASLDRLETLLERLYAQNGLILPGKRMPRQVFRSCGGTHGHNGGPQSAVYGCDLLAQSVRQRFASDEPANLSEHVLCLV